MHLSINCCRGAKWELCDNLCLTPSTEIKKMPASKNLRINMWIKCFWCYPNNYSENVFEGFSHFVLCIFKFFLRFYLFVFREVKGETGRETSLCGCLLHAPYWRPGSQPRPAPWLGMEPVNFWFTGRHSIHWATPAGVREEILKNYYCPRYTKTLTFMSRAQEGEENECSGRRKKGGGKGGRNSNNNNNG